MTLLRTPLFALSVTVTGLAAAYSAPISAQTTTSRPVVQPLPSGDVRDLKETLRVLARRPRDLNALLDAGYASLKVQDFEAAIGFFGRAEEVSPEHPRVKMGKAAVYLRSGRPIEALRLFAEAEAAGATARDVHSDRGLAYDLVGDQLRAQAHYREALRQTPDDPETVRRMALSQAIAGNESAFAQTLRPLIDKRDFPAFRSQAFGLAILGEEQRAKAVTEAVMPAELARRITPYLGYMPRLTKSQQAAAANLGIFPRAADIGRDDPQIAQYTSGERAAAASTVFASSANNRLAPAGQPIGQPAAQAAQSAAPLASAPATAPVPAQAPASAPASARIASLPTIPASTSTPAPAPAPVITNPPVLAGPTRVPASQSAAAPAPVRSVAKAAETAPAVGPGFDLNQTAAPPQPAPLPSTPATTRPSAPVRVNQPAAVPVRVSRPETAPGAVRSIPAAPVPSPISTPVVQPKPDPNFADAFADMSTATTATVAPAANAVDINSINIPREARPESKPEPASIAAPKESISPQRFWVQLGTASRAEGLRFDWRRLARQEPDLLGDLEGHTAAYGEQFRLLAGPVSSKAKRDELVKALTDKGLGVLPYTSPEGAEVQPLK